MQADKNFRILESKVGTKKALEIAMRVDKRVKVYEEKGGDKKINKL